MADRRWLIAVALFALLLHGLAIAHTVLPAQDGLKYIGVARAFQVQPWDQVVRGTDLHPLYPGLVAVVEPMVALFLGATPLAWRVAAQGVSAIASTLLIVPIDGLSRRLFDGRVALLAASLVVLYPHVAELGRETLGDSVGLFLIFTTLWLAVEAMLGGRVWLGLAAGGAAGLGYWARPEAILAPVVIGLAWLLDWGLQKRAGARPRLRPLVALVGLWAAILAGYTAVKGELSEKLAVRMGAALGKSVATQSSSIRAVPPGLNDPRLDFSAKEESATVAIRGVPQALARIGCAWADQTAWLFGVMAIWGLVRIRFIRGLCRQLDERASRATARLLLILMVVYVAAMVRHSVVLGYLSDRHVTVLLLATAPFSAAGSFVCARGIAVQGRMKPALARPLGLAAGVLVIIASITAQTRPHHAAHWSRRAHLEAGRWLAANTGADERVLDTRGWARFVADRLGYDYWHVRQALTDSHLKYVVVGLDELAAESPRAATLRKLLAATAQPIVQFPPDPQARKGVRIYRFARPDSWEECLR